MSINILILNAGSSSLKFQLYKMPSEKELYGGIAERIGQKDAVLHWHKAETKAKEIPSPTVMPDHTAALQQIVRLLRQEQKGVEDDIDLIVHRVVHGGPDFDRPVLITEKVRNRVRELSELAPLHNPVSLHCIEAIDIIFPGIKQVAVFDTSFHHQLPEHSFRYAIPDRFYKEGIRAYGFHGINHQYVSNEAMAVLKNKNAKLISMHLGNGCSICAVISGRSVDTSMGFGPVSGLVMATRSGDIDPSVILHLMRKYDLDETEMDNILNKESGLAGLCGMTDLRDIHKAILKGNKEASFACELYTYRIKKYIGAYAAAMNGLDAIIFTGGVGENAAYIREQVCKKMDWVGITLDEELNSGIDPGITSIGTSSSRVPILVIPANEALEMARQSFGLYSA
jgi:acetate kinase